MATTKKSFSQFLSAISPQEPQLAEELKQLIEDVVDSVDNGGVRIVSGIMIAVAKSGKAALVAVPCTPDTAADCERFTGIAPEHYTDAQGNPRYGVRFQVGLSPRGRVTWTRAGWPTAQANAAPADTVDSTVDAADVDL